MIDDLLIHEQLIKAIASKFATFHDFDDLVQVGWIGLKKAYDNFKEDGGAKLTTYAYKYILGEIKQYVYKDKGIKISRDVINLSKTIEIARGELTQAMMRQPTMMELSLYLNMESDKIEEVLAASFNLMSLDEAVNDDDLTLYDTVAKEETVDLDNTIMLKDAVLGLEEPARSLIINRYYNDQSQQETANILGMSQVQVSRVEAKTLKLLRDKIAA